MMAPDPADRFASYDELLRAIENVSAQYTRPGGFFSRAIAKAIDLISILIIIGVASALMPTDRTIPADTIGFTVFLVTQFLLLGRFGSTLGYALFELEVASVETGHKPTWRQAALRTLYLGGPVIFFMWLSELLSTLEVSGLFQKPAAAMVGVVIAIDVIHLAYASARTPGKRTWWDRRAGTIVRYRRMR
jgi:uncharacterized RDD family membrane protein YckC